MCSCDVSSHGCMKQDCVVSVASKHWCVPVTESLLQWELLLSGWQPHAVPCSQCSKVTEELKAAAGSGSTHTRSALMNTCVPSSPLLHTRALADYCSAAM
jgi:hypothetical protein